MKREQIVVLCIAIACITLAAFHETSAGPPKVLRTEITTEILTIGIYRPRIWMFLNDSETNTRVWSDFMSRTSNVINIPLLNLCYETVLKHNGQTYQIELIGGLQRVAELLGGWEALPKYMSNPKASVNEPEEDWIRSAILAKYGGLWLSASVLCLKPFGELPTDKIVAFGQDYSSMYGSAIPGFRALWAPKPDHSVFVEMEKRCRSRLETQTGGRQVRGDSKSDWLELVAPDQVEYRVKEELGRDPKTNKKLDLEHIFASGTGGRLPFDIPESTVYVPIPYDDLMNRRMFGWILRSSQDQIMESDLAIRYIIEKALS